MANEAHSWQAIVALAAVLQAFAVAVIRYLVKEIDKRDELLKTANSVIAESIRLNAEVAALVPGLIKENQERLRRIEYLEAVNKGHSYAIPVPPAVP